MTTPTQKPRNASPLWRLPEGIINASDSRLKSASDSCERWEWGCAGFVAMAVVAEFAIAWAHPAYNSTLERWGSVWADFAVAAGIVGEMIFSNRDSKIQTELRRRSDQRLGKAVTAAGNANQRAAKLEKEAALLRARQADRTILDQALFLGRLNDCPTPLVVKLLRSPLTEEAGQLAFHLWMLLEMANWPVSFPQELAADDKRLYGAPSTADIERPYAGIRISMCDAEKEDGGKLMQASRLASAIRETLGEVQTAPHTGVAPATIEVVIFPKA